MFDYTNLRPFNESTARFYFRQLIDAVEYLHSNGVVNRDLKLENLLLDINYNLKVADFGFCAPAEGRDGSGRLKTDLGTDIYKAPEVGKSAYDGVKVDIYNCGVILFMMVIHRQYPTMC